MGMCRVFLVGKNRGFKYNLDSNYLM